MKYLKRKLKELMNERKIGRRKEARNPYLSFSGQIKSNDSF
jgi:hypothetical protein